MSDYKDNVDKLGSKSKTVAAILKGQWDDSVDERNELLEALKRLLAVMGEGGRRGRPMDLLDRQDYKYAVIPAKKLVEKMTPK